jgi:hypothetical protein
LQISTCLIAFRLDSFYLLGFVAIPCANDLLLVTISRHHSIFVASIERDRK